MFSLLIWNDSGAQVQAANALIIALFGWFRQLHFACKVTALGSCLLCAEIAHWSMGLDWEWHRNSPRKILSPYITLENDKKM